MNKNETTTERYSSISPFGFTIVCRDCSTRTLAFTIPTDEREQHDAWHAEAVTYCEWFALCDHAATGTMPHPVLGDVPICDRCKERATA